MHNFTFFQCFVLLLTNCCPCSSESTIRGRSIKGNGGQEPRSLEEIPDRKAPPFVSKESFKLARSDWRDFLLEAPSPAPSNPLALILSPAPTNIPSSEPSASQPSESPTSISENPLQTRFYAIGDVPYTNLQKMELIQQIETLPDDAEFLLHLGDIRSGNISNPCELADYQDVANILLSSTVPVFVVPGDNEWNDCVNPAAGKSHWKAVFEEFDKNWQHSFQTQYHSPVSFHFVHKQTLFIGLSLLGGVVSNETEWSIRVTDLYNYVEECVETRIRTNGEASSIVIFAHAWPDAKNAEFFTPLQAYIQDDLQNEYPILYLHGDKHIFEYEANYLNQTNWNRMGVEGEGRNPPLQVSINMSMIEAKKNLLTSEVFAFDRMLPASPAPSDRLALIPLILSPAPTNIPSEEPSESQPSFALVLTDAPTE